MFLINLKISVSHVLKIFFLGIRYTPKFLFFVHTNQRCVQDVQVSLGAFEYSYSEKP